MLSTETTPDIPFDANNEELEEEFDSNSPNSTKMTAEEVAACLSQAKRKLMKDFKHLQQSSPESLGVYARLEKNDLFHWRAVITGPDNTPWEGGLFKLDLTFTPTYPVTPPKVRFRTALFHPNVYVNGDICLNTLKNNWSPSLNVQSLLLSIQSLLSDPNPHSSANPEAGHMLLENPDLYHEKVRSAAEASLQQEFTSEDDEEDAEN